MDPATLCPLLTVCSLQPGMMKKNEYAKTLSQKHIVQGNIGSVVGERLVLLRVALRCGVVNAGLP